MNVCANGASATERALGVELARVAVGDLGDGGGRRHEAHLDALEPRQRQLHEVGVLGQVPHERTLARVAEPGHAVLHVGDEALPGLLAVVADVDAGLHLVGDRRGRGLLDGAFAARRDRPPRRGSASRASRPAPPAAGGSRRG